MTTRWKVAIVAALVLACVAVGLAVAAWLATDVEIAQSGVDPDAPLTIDLTQVVLQYNDQLRGIGPQQVTIRQVIQDSLWYQVNNPQATEQMRMECFSMINLFHEGRATEITQAQYAVLIEALQIVWGPGVLAQFEAMVGGEP